MVPDPITFIVRLTPVTYTKGLSSLLLTIFVVSGQKKALFKNALVHLSPKSFGVWVWRFSNETAVSDDWPWTQADTSGIHLSTTRCSLHS